MTIVEEEAPAGELPEPAFSPAELARLMGAEHPPTAEQAAIISSPLEPMLVVAGAGSGKTKTMADRVVWLVANGWVRPEEILGVTFTRKAAGELSARIRAQLALLARKGLMPKPDGEAADEMLDPKVSTYHSYASGIVGDYGLRLGIERDTVLLGAAQSWQLASTIVESYEGAAEHFTAAKSSLVKAVIDLAAECAEHLRDPQEVRDLLDDAVERLSGLPYVSESSRKPSQEVGKLVNRLRTRSTVAELVQHYIRAKRAQGAMDFGDLMSLAARIAVDIPAAAQLERQRYRVVLLDEFQDTSHAQMELFSRLFGAGHAVTAVGDPNQSIYGFRGASDGQLFRFPERFPRVGPEGRRELAAVRFLTTAWRNSTNILDMANAVAAPLNGPAVNASAGTGTGSGAGRIRVPALQARPGAPAGGVRLSRFASDKDEATAVADRIQQLRGPGAQEPGAPRQLPSMAVLCRKRAQMEPLRREFEERGIPYEIVGLGGLLSTPEIVDLVAVLRVLADPTRSDSLMRLLSGARWRLGPADLMAFSDWSRHLARQREAAARQHTALDLDSDEPPAGEPTIEHDVVDGSSLVEALDRLPRPGWTSRHGRCLTDAALARLSALRAELRHLRSFVGDDLTTLIGEVERATLLDIEVASKPGVSIHQARRNLDAFTDAAAGFLQTSQRVDLLAFLGWLEAAAAEEGGLDVVQTEVSHDAVQLLTVHASKGLEWDVVFVPGLNAGAFPSNKDSRWSSGNSALPWPLRGDHAELPAWDTDQPDQKGWLDSEKAFKGDCQAHGELEERRLAYVAYTRARHELHCSSAAWVGSRAAAAGTSTFLAELLPLAEGPAASAQRGTWIDDEAVGSENPNNAAEETALWPYDPLEGPLDATTGRRLRPGAGRRAQVEGAAGAVRAARAELAAGAVFPPDRWSRETELLLARHNDRSQSADVQLPAHISASLLVELADNPAEVTRRLRRPVPRKPGMAARKGTAFHAWVEDYFGSSGMLDIDEFPGAADAYVDEAYELEEMIRTFKASPWAQRSPAFIEVPVETRVDTVVVRGRIDAVFRGPDGSWELVDWKTGLPPAKPKLGIRSVQLAAYRLAWARLKGVEVNQVKAAFYYVAADTIIRPHDLAGEAELEEIVRRAYASGDGA